MSEQDRKPAIGDFRFHTEYTPSKDDPEKMVPGDWVSWIKIGDALGSRTVEKITRLMPNKDRGRPAAIEWDVIKQSYEAWKEGQEMPVDGTPLAAWPGCDTSLAEMLKRQQVYTVEQFADLPDHFMTRIALPDIRARREAAQQYIKTKATAAAVSSELQAQIDALRKELAEAKGDEPKRRGRPPKVEVEAVE